MRSGATHEKHSHGNLNLALRTEDRDDIRSSFFIREADMRVCLGLDVANEYALFAKKSPMVPTGNRDGLVYVVFILEVKLRWHAHNNGDVFAP